MSIYSIHPPVLGGVRTYPLATRKSKVNVREFARPSGKRGSCAKFLDSLPEILAAQDLRDRSRRYSAQRGSSARFFGGSAGT